MITPQEIRQKTFKKSLRGYDTEEVQAFLQALSQEWGQQLEGFQQLKEELARTKASYQTLKEVEDMLHRTLMQAEQSARDTVENARQKADLKVREAEARAQEILRKGVEDRNHVQHEITELVRRRDQLFSQLQLFLQTQIERLQDFERSELPAYTPPVIRRAEPTPPPPPVSEASFFDDKSAPNPNGSEGNFFEDLSDEL